MPSLRVIDESEQVLEPVNQTLCEICQKQFSNYVCPRCNLRYCSLACYKDLQHADCTESFYKESVTAEIQSRDLDKDSKNKMMEMLRRLQEENNNQGEIDEDDYDDEDDNDDFISRFEDLDIEKCDADTIWNLLSEKERKEFEAALTRGNLEDFDLPAFQPWWITHGSSAAAAMIQEMELLSPSQQQQQQDIPSLPEPFPDFEKLTKPEARNNPHLLWNMLNILLTYSYLVRHTMGDLLDDANDTLNMTMSLSTNVLYSTTAGCPFNNVGDVVTDIVQQIINIDNQSSSSLSKQQQQQQPQQQHSRHYDLKLLLLNDLKALTKQEENFHIRAIHDFWQALDQISSTTTKTKAAKSGHRKKTLLAVRKLYFYLAAACYLDKQRLSTLHFAIETEHTKMTLEKEEFERDHDAAQSAIEKAKKTSNKIQEL